MFAGAIPGLTKEDAHEWAKDTNFKKLPERAASQKGKPRMRTKKAVILVYEKKRPDQKWLDINEGESYMDSVRRRWREQQHQKKASRRRDKKPSTGTLGTALSAVATPYIGSGAIGSLASGPGDNRVRRAAGTLAGEAAGAYGGAALARKLPRSTSWKRDLALQLATHQGAKALGAAGGNAVTHALTKEAAEMIAEGIGKCAALGTAVVSSNNVGKLRGMMTSHAMKAPGPGPLARTVQPGKAIQQAMTVRSPR